MATVTLRYLALATNAASAKALNQMLAYMGQGLGAAAARKRAGVANHTHGELWVFMAQWHAAGCPTPGQGAWAPTPQLVRYLRQQPLGGQSGWGWGRIMVALGQPGAPLTLTTVHNLFAANGTLAQGQRVGAGGRMWQGNAALYQSTLKATGTNIPVGQQANATLLAQQQMLAKYTIGQLRQLAQQQGLSQAGTKAQLVKALVAKGVTAQQ